MIQLNVVLIVTVISIQTVTNAIVTATDPKHELLTEILGRYRLASRHIHESQTVINYKVQLPIHDIIKVDGSTNEFVFRATIQLSYQFEFLRWNANDTQNRYYDIDEVTLSKSVLQTLWLPNIHLADEEYLSFTIEHESGKITRDGHITWTRRGLFTVASPIDLTYYPFDYQYIRINLENKEKAFKLQHDKYTNASKLNSYLSRSFNLWTRLFGNTDFNISHNTNNSLMYQENELFFKPILLRGWFVRTLGIESKNGHENSDHLTLYILIQRRREPHIYTTILPTLFFSVFIFVFYFSSIKSYQRLVIGLLHSFAILIFIVHLDKRISAEQLSYTPLIIRYLSIIFLIEILSLFFDHIIHSIYYGGIHTVSNWLRKTDNNEAQPPRLSRVKLLTHGLNFNNADNDEGTNVLMKQLIEREESLKYEDLQSYQWHQQACFSECLCCSFFLIIIIVVFIFTFFILPSLSLSKMT